MANYGSTKSKRTGKSFGLQFSGFSEKIEELDRLSHWGVVEGTKEALTDTHKYVTKRAEESMKGHYVTGETIKSLVKEPKVEVSGPILSISIGFDLDRGGYPSMFLMYGTPRQNPDIKVYRAIFGKATSDEIAHIQYQAIKKTINKYLNK